MFSQGYKNPLSERLQLTNEGQKVVQTMFGNVEDLYSLHRYEDLRSDEFMMNVENIKEMQTMIVFLFFLCRWLLDELNSHEGDPHEFGKIFSDNVHIFHIRTLCGH